MDEAIAAAGYPPTAHLKEVHEKGKIEFLSPGETRVKTEITILHSLQTLLPEDLKLTPDKTYPFRNSGGVYRWGNRWFIQEAEGSKNWMSGFLSPNGATFCFWFFATFKAIDGELYQAEGDLITGQYYKTAPIQTFTKISWPF